MPVAQQTSRKVTQLAETLRRQILNRQIKTGARLPTQRELSVKFNVAPNTAFAAMALLEGEGLVVRRQGSGNYVSEQLPHGATGMLHFVRRRQAQGERERLTDLGFLEEASVLATTEGFQGVSHHLSHEELSQPDQIVDRFAGARGVILRWNDTLGLAWLLHQRGIPVVLFTAPLASGEAPLAPFVQLTADLNADFAMAVDHLVGLGCRRIVFATRPYWTTYIGVFLQTIRRHAAAASHSSIVQGVDPELMQWVRGLASQEDRPDAICCGTEYLARLIVQWLLESGLRVPQDIRIVACADGPDATYCPVQVTTASSLGNAQTAPLSMQLVLQTEPGFDPSTMPMKPALVPPTVLTVRESCGARPGASNREITISSGAKLTPVTMAR